METRTDVGVQGRSEITRNFRAIKTFSGIRMLIEADITILVSHARTVFSLARLQPIAFALWNGRFTLPLLCLPVMPESETLPQLKNVTKKSLERVQTRLRSNLVTSSAWRLEVESAEGSGSITLVDLSPTESYYRGDGLFLGWTQLDLATAYRSFLPQSEPSASELPQLG
jgi:hypothetical protein